MKPYLNVLAKDPGIGPLRLLYDKSLKNSIAMSTIQKKMKMEARIRTQGVEKITHKKTSWGKLADAEGNGPDRVLLLSLLQRIAINLNLAWLWKKKLSKEHH
jgi:hypothetical protein